ncbi:MAG: ABC transporter permease [Candidatus Rokubacteria bacterium]|nr:ABC transporter permease [Candidatus Rokubacteria bacterium]
MYRTISVLAYGELVRNLVLKDLKLKYRDSVLGFLWSLANPLLLILVYGFVFTHMLRTDIPNFAYFLIVGILPWNFFAQSLLMSTVSILENGTLIRTVWLPLEVFPVATVLFNLAHYFLALVVFLPVSAVFLQVRPAPSMLAFFPLLALHVLFTLGLGFIICTATVFYRDVRHFTENLLMPLFWLTPIVYEIDTLPETLRAIIYLNPLSHFILGYQDILYRRTLPDPTRLLTLLVVSTASFVAGYALFRRCKARFPEEV